MKLKGFVCAGVHPALLLLIIVTDSIGKTHSDNIEITVRELPQGALLGEEVLDNTTVAGGGRGGEISPRQGGGITTEEPEEESPPGGRVPPPQ